MTVKRYYEDCHLQEFTAKVLSCTPEGENFAVVLTETAFYPEGGGQASDTGTLGDARVVHVKEVGGDIIHLCTKSMHIGDTITGQIDWAHRFDLMQQHSGEHIVSGILNRMFGVHNVGFHMGSDVTTIDFDGEIPPSAIAEVERQANEAIWKNLPVICTVPSPEELEKAVYRTKRALPYPVRLVEIPGYDCCACCGVHVAATGEIGLIKILSAIRFRQGTRMQMVCGSRALSAMQTIFEQNRLVSQAFSAKIWETGAAAEKMNDALTEEKYRSAGLRRQLFGIIAEGYRNRGDCVCIKEGLAPAEVRELANQIAEVCGGIACVIGTGSALPFCMISKTGDVRPAAKMLMEALNGHGGGKPGHVQGSLGRLPENTAAVFVEKLNFNF